MEKTMYYLAPECEVISSDMQEVICTSTTGSGTTNPYDDGGQFEW